MKRVLGILREHRSVAFSENSVSVPNRKVRDSVLRLAKREDNRESKEAVLVFGYLDGELLGMRTNIVRCNDLLCGQSDSCRGQNE